jgi:hypothetical protein
LRFGRVKYRALLCWLDRVLTAASLDEVFATDG